MLLSIALAGVGPFSYITCRRLGGDIGRVPIEKGTRPPKPNLSYAAVIDVSFVLIGESRQPAAWMPLLHDWEGVFPEDRPRIRDFARKLEAPAN